jgi:hypothetical protein
MINSNRIFYLLFIFLGFSIAAFAQEEPSAFKQLSRGADVILTGKVTQKISSWDKTKSRIYTKASLQVNEYLKGTTNDNVIDVTYPGGEVGDVGEIYTHMPTFEDNEEVLVFLKKNGKTRQYQVFSGEKGKITVLKDAKTKEKVTRTNVRIEVIKEQIKEYIKTQQ